MIHVFVYKSRYLFDYLTLPDDSLHIMYFKVIMMLLNIYPFILFHLPFYLIPLTRTFIKIISDTNKYLCIIESESTPTAYVFVVSGFFRYFISYPNYIIVRTFLLLLWYC